MKIYTLVLYTINTHKCTFLCVRQLLHCDYAVRFASSKICLPAVESDNGTIATFRSITVPSGPPLFKANHKTYVVI